MSRRSSLSSQVTAVQSDCLPVITDVCLSVCRSSQLSVLCTSPTQLMSVRLSVCQMFEAVVAWTSESLPRRQEYVSQLMSVRLSVCQVFEAVVAWTSEWLPRRQEYVSQLMSVRLSVCQVFEAVVALTSEWLPRRQEYVSQLMSVRLPVCLSGVRSGRGVDQRVAAPPSGVRLPADVCLSACLSVRCLRRSWRGPASGCPAVRSTSPS